MSETVRIGVLGCGNVGAALVELIDERRRRDRGPHRACASRSPASPCATCRASAPSTCPTACSPATPPRSSTIPTIDVVVEVIGGIEPARELILAALQARQAGRHRQQGAAGQRRRRAVRRRRRRRASTCCSRRRSPAASRSIRPLRESLAGEPHPPRHGHRQRHDQLHPHPDDRGGRRYGDALAEAQSLGLRRARPHRRRRGLRRRRQGGDHRVDRVRRPGRRRRRLPRGHQPDHRRRHRVRHAPRLRRQAARHRRADPTTARSRCASTRRWCPLPHPLASVRDSFNAVFVEGDAVGVADVLRPRRRRPPDGERGARRPHRRRRQPAQGHARRRSARSAEARDPADRRDDVPSTTSASRWSTGPACSHAVAGVFARHDVSIRAMEQEGLGDDARLVFITHDAHARPTCRRRCATCATSTSSTQVGSAPARHRRLSS